MHCTRRFFCLVITPLLLFGGCRKDVLRNADAQQITHGPDVRWNRIVLVSDSLWLVAGGEKFERADIFLTRDAGASWSHQSFPEMGKGIYGLDASRDGALVACGFTSSILTTPAGTWDWRANMVPEARFYLACALLANGRKVLLSTVTYEAGQILLLDAENRVLKANDFLFGLSDLGFVDDTRGYAAGYGAVLRTDDGGENWSYTTASDDQFTALDVHGPDTAYSCGYAGSILRTTNGGRSWQQLRGGGGFGQPAYALQDLIFTDDQHGYCVGEDGLVIYTDDGGAHWMEYERFTSAELRGIAALPGGDLLVCGDAGALWRLTVR